VKYNINPDEESVTDMTIAGQQLGKHISEVTLPTIEGRPLLSNGSLGMFPQQRIRTQ
jgi:hypothetical protein